MSLRDRLLEFGAKKSAKQYLTQGFEDLGELEFEISSISLSDLLNNGGVTDSFHMLINGYPEDFDYMNKAEDLVKLVEGANAAVIAGVRVREVGTEDWLSFNEDDFNPRAIFPEFFIIQLAEKVKTNFRI